MVKKTKVNKEKNWGKVLALSLAISLGSSSIPYNVLADNLNLEEISEISIQGLGDKVKKIKDKKKREELEKEIKKLEDKFSEINSMDIQKPYLKGYPDGTVKPENHISRQEAATIINNLTHDDYDKNNFNITFTDIKSNHWSYESIKALSQMGIINGYEDGSFRPDDKLTRAEAVTILVKYSLKDNIKDKKIYKSDLKNHWAQKYMSIAIANGWLKGYPDGKYRPDDKINRAEFIALINRVLKIDKNLNYESIKDKLPRDLYSNKWYFKDIVNAMFDGREYSNEELIENIKELENKLELIYLDEIDEIRDDVWDNDINIDKNKLMINKLKEELKEINNKLLAGLDDLNILEDKKRKLAEKINEKEENIREEILKLEKDMLSKDEFNEKYTELESELNNLKDIKENVIKNTEEIKKLKNKFDSLDIPNVKEELDKIIKDINIKDDYNDIKLEIDSIEALVTEVIKNANDIKKLEGLIYGNLELDGLEGLLEGVEELNEKLPEEDKNKDTIKELADDVRELMKKFEKLKEKINEGDELISRASVEEISKGINLVQKEVQLRYRHLELELDYIKNEVDRLDKEKADKIEVKGLRLITELSQNIIYNNYQLSKIRNKYPRYNYSTNKDKLEKYDYIFESFESNTNKNIVKNIKNIEKLLEDLESGNISQEKVEENLEKINVEQIWEDSDQELKELEEKLKDIVPDDLNYLLDNLIEIINYAEKTLTDKQVNELKEYLKKIEYIDIDIENKNIEILDKYKGENISEELKEIIFNIDKKVSEEALRESIKLANEIVGDRENLKLIDLIDKSETLLSEDYINIISVEQINSLKKELDKAIIEQRLVDIESYLDQELDYKDFLLYQETMLKNRYINHIIGGDNFYNEIYKHHNKINIISKNKPYKNTRILKVLIKKDYVLEKVSDVRKLHVKVTGNTNYPDFINHAEIRSGKGDESITINTGTGSEASIEKADKELNEHIKKLDLYYESLSYNLI